MNIYPSEFERLILTDPHKKRSYEMPNKKIHFIKALFKVLMEGPKNVIIII